MVMRVVTIKLVITIMRNSFFVRHRFDPDKIMSQKLGHKTSLFMIAYEKEFGWN